MYIGRARQTKGCGKEEVYLFLLEAEVSRVYLLDLSEDPLLRLRIFQHLDVLKQQLHNFLVATFSHTHTTSQL